MGRVCNTCRLLHKIFECYKDRHGTRRGVGKKQPTCSSPGLAPGRPPDALIIDHSPVGSWVTISGFCKLQVLTQANHIQPMGHLLPTPYKPDPVRQRLSGADEPSALEEGLIARRAPLGSQLPRVGAGTRFSTRGGARAHAARGRAGWMAEGAGRRAAPRERETSSAPKNKARQTHNKTEDN